MHLSGQSDCFVKGYHTLCFVPEVHHGVVRDQGIHQVDHVVFAQSLLLGRDLVCGDVQSFVHLGYSQQELRGDSDSSLPQSSSRSPPTHTRKGEGLARLPQPRAHRPILHALKTFPFLPLTPSSDPGRDEDTGHAKEDQIQSWCQPTRQEQHLFAAGPDAALCV